MALAEQRDMAARPSQHPTIPRGCESSGVISAVFLTSNFTKHSKCVGRASCSGSEEMLSGGGCSQTCLFSLLLAGAQRCLLSS